MENQPIDFTSTVLPGASGRVRYSTLGKVMVTYREGDTYREIIAARPEMQWIVENFGKDNEVEYKYMCSTDLQNEVLEQASIFAGHDRQLLTNNQLKGLL